MSRPIARLRPLLLLFAMAALTAAGPCWGFGQHHGDPKRVERGQIEALENQCRNAQLADDVPAMDKLLSEDFLGITANGELNTKAQFLDRMRNRVLVISTMQVSDQKIKLVGDVAIVTSLVQVTGNSEGLPIAGSFRYTRVYQRLPGRMWKITNFEITPARARNRRAAADAAEPPKS
jgi:ketosteroid isomerase-like protein